MGKKHLFWLIAILGLQLFQVGCQNKKGSSPVSTPSGSSSGTKIYVGSYTSGLFISTDGGATFTNKTSADGLGNNNINSLYVSGNTVYAGIGYDDQREVGGGLSISTDGGATFTNKTTANGLPYDSVESVYVSAGIIYVASAMKLSISTDGGATFITNTKEDYLCEKVYASGGSIYCGTTGSGYYISTDGGNNFTNRMTNIGDGSDYYYSFAVSANSLYMARSNGLSISNDGGSTFTNKTTADGLGDDYVSEVYVSGGIIYAATYAGLSISSDGGATFVNKTTRDGLGGDEIISVYASGNTIYAGTREGLSISNDGGATFVNHLNNLPISSVKVSGSGN